jgi:hypothetical protein
MRKESITRLIALSLVLVAFATACDGLVRKGEKPSDDWSRSVVIGENAVGSLGMAVADAGQRTHVVWPYEDEKGLKLRIVELDEQASITVAEDLVYPGHLRSPRLVAAGSRNLHLFWASRQPGSFDWQMWHQLLTVDGHPAGQPAMLTEESSNVGRYGVYSDGNDGALVIWDSGSNSGLNALRLDAEGGLISGPHSITASGDSPTFRVDPQGRAHLAWEDDRSFFYAELMVEDLSTVKTTKVVDLDQWGTLNSSGDSLQGPALAYADGWIYLFWSIVSLTDIEAGSGVAEFVTFPQGSPSALQPARIWSIPAEEQPYIENQNSLSLTQLSQPRHIADAAEEYGVQVLFENQIAGDWSNVSGAVSSYMLSPATMIGDQKDLAVAMAVSQEKGSDTHLQIAATVFSEGQYVGYNFAGKTSYLSDDPILASDGSGDLHVAWREGAHGETIYYATTAEKAKTSLDRLEASDLAIAAPQGLTDGLAGIAFTPFVALCWVLPGLLLLGSWQLARDENSLTKSSNWIPLVVSLLLYYGLKLAFFPSFTTYVPLSAWLYIAPSMEEPLRAGFPLLIVAIGALVAVRLRRSYGDSMLPFFLTWVATDALLTLFFYGVVLLGTF